MSITLRGVTSVNYPMIDRLDSALEKKGAEDSYLKKAATLMDSNQVKALALEIMLKFDSRKPEILEDSYGRFLNVIAVIDIVCIALLLSAAITCFAIGFPFSAVLLLKISKMFLMFSILSSLALQMHERNKNIVNFNKFELYRLNESMDKIYTNTRQDLSGWISILRTYNIETDKNHKAWFDVIFPEHINR